MDNELNVDKIAGIVMEHLPGLIRKVVEEERAEQPKPDAQADVVAAFTTAEWVLWADADEFEFHADLLGNPVVEGMALRSPDHHKAAIRYSADTELFHVYGEGVPANILVDGQHVVLAANDSQVPIRWNPTNWHYYGVLPRAVFVSMLERHKENAIRHIDAQIARVANAAKGHRKEAMAP